MKYIMKAGTLYFNDIVSARIKGAFIGSEKKIYSASGSILMRTDIANLEVPPNETGNVRYRQYILFDGSGNTCAVANPDYAEWDDPTVVGWPLCRIPRVDHAKVVYDNNEYLLVMQNDQNYLLSDKFSKAVIQIFHRGLVGGWNIEVMNDFAPEIICGIFVFCKYIEQENEFLVV
jgi:hypothetical protein